MGQYGIVWNSSVVEVAGIEPANSFINSKPCRVWCPYRCPSVQIKGALSPRILAVLSSSNGPREN